MGRLWKSSFSVQALANIHCFALWIHHIIHTNLICCSISHVLFAFPLSGKSIIFICSFENLTKCKSKTIEKRQGLPSNLIDLGLKIHLPKSCFRHLVFIEIWRCNWVCSKYMVFITCSPHHFAKIQASKQIKRNIIQWPPTASQNDPKLKTSIFH